MLLLQKSPYLLNKIAVFYIIFILYLFNCAVWVKTKKRGPLALFPTYLWQSLASEQPEHPQPQVISPLCLFLILWITTQTINPITIAAIIIVAKLSFKNCIIVVPPYLTGILLTN
jgi:hypothetical protein